MNARAPVAAPALVVLAIAQLALWYASSGPLAYGYMSDEMYYFDCAERLAWGYVDHPPLSVFVLAGVRALLGESLQRRKQVAPRSLLLPQEPLERATLLGAKLGGQIRWGRGLRRGRGGRATPGRGRSGDLARECQRALDLA